MRGRRHAALTVSRNKTSKNITVFFQFHGTLLAPDSWFDKETNDPSTVLDWSSKSNGGVAKFKA